MINSELGPITGLIAVMLKVFQLWNVSFDFLGRIYAQLECWGLRCQTCSKPDAPGFQGRLRCQCVRCIQYCSRCRKVSHMFHIPSRPFFKKKPCFPYTRLWMSHNTEGSIVITCSMSSQIINKTAEAEPLTQVRTDFRTTWFFFSHITNFFFPPGFL